MKGWSLEVVSDFCFCLFWRMPFCLDWIYRGGQRFWAVLQIKSRLSIREWSTYQGIGDVLFKSGIKVTIGQSERQSFRLFFID